MTSVAALPAPPDRGYIPLQPLASSGRLNAAAARFAGNPGWTPGPSIFRCTCLRQGASPPPLRGGSPAPPPIGGHPAPQAPAQAWSGFASSPARPRPRPLPSVGPSLRRGADQGARRYALGAGAGRPPCANGPLGGLPPCRSATLRLPPAPRQGLGGLGWTPRPAFAAPTRLCRRGVLPLVACILLWEGVWYGLAFRRQTQTRRH